MTITEKVADRLKKISPEVESKVVDLLTDKEVNRRVEMISQGLGKLEEMEKEKRKLDKPDVETFNSDGSVATSGFTKERMEDRKKTDEKIGKMERAIEKALAGDIGDLANLVR